MNIVQTKRDIDYIERMLYYEKWDCYCPDEMRNTHKPDCERGKHIARLAELRAKL